MKGCNCLNLNLNLQLFANRALRVSAYLIAMLLLSYCEPQESATPEVVAETVDPLATDSFFMRNPEIREDLFEQLEIHEVEYWVNEDNSIGFYVKDTKEVDRIANESISVWITSQ